MNVLPLTSAIAVRNSAFLSTLAPTLRVDEYLWVCAYRNDPHDDDIGKWKGREYRHGAAWFDDLTDSHNQYFSVSILRGGDEAGRGARRKPFFSRLMALVADDFHVEDVRGTPTWVVQTSPASSQVGFAIDPADPDAANVNLIDALMDAMSTRGLIKGDTSGNNLVRYVRLPNGLNTKKRPSGDYRTQLRVWNPSAVYSLQDAAAAIGIDVDDLRAAETTYTPAAPVGDTIPSGARNETLASLAGSMRRRGMSAAAIEAALFVENLRCEPPLSDGEVRQIAESIARYTPQEVDAIVDLSGLLAQIGRKEGSILLDIAELEAVASNLQWAVKHVIPEGCVGMLFGASGAFKSFIAIDYALHRSYGMNWLGKKTKQGRVVYLAAEGGSGILRRVKAWHQARGMDWKKCPMRFITVPLTMRTQASFLRKQIEATGLKVTDIIIDTMSQTYTGNENSSDEVAEYFRAIGYELRSQLNCTAMIVHHTGHSATERPRGASAIIGNLDFLLGAFREEKEMIATLTCLKQKDEDRFGDMTFDLTLHELGKDEDGDPITSLAAKHISGTEQAQALLRESSAGRSTHLSAIQSIAREGMLEAELRKEFYKTLPDTASHDTRKKAFSRARDKAVAAGLFVVDHAGGNVVRFCG